MWMRYMLAAFLTNGLGAFGVRVLIGLGLGGRYNLEYLGCWYAAGCAVAASIYLRQHGKPFGRELLIGGGMACCSVFGQLGMILALEKGLPGFVVFPVAVGGGLLFVVAVGVVFYRERLSRAGYLGIVLGSIALVLLSLP
jgi:multidrug transporter EmrE-like cation transporter